MIIFTSMDQPLVLTGPKVGEAEHQKKNALLCCAYLIVSGRTPQIGPGVVALWIPMLVSLSRINSSSADKCLTNRDIAPLTPTQLSSYLTIPCQTVEYDIGEA